MRTSLEERFLNKVRKTSTCWIWEGYCNGNGYGKVRVLGQSVSCHRVSYELFVGEIPKDMHVLHRCDTPPCVNPSHLWVGTHLQNQQDKARKGRSTRLLGERHPLHKLTDEMVREAAKLWPSMNYSDIGKKYGVTGPAIRYALTGKTWKHLQRV